jgi:hypothetical protein
MPKPQSTTTNPVNEPMATSDQSARPEFDGRQPWPKATGGGWMLIVFGLFALVGLVVASGRVWLADSVGEDDVGVVHSQPMGVDDDVSPRYDTAGQTGN